MVWQLHSGVEATTSEARVSSLEIIYMKNGPLLIGDQVATPQFDHLLVNMSDQYFVNGSWSSKASSVSYLNEIELDGRCSYLLLHFDNVTAHSGTPGGCFARQNFISATILLCA